MRSSLAAEWYTQIRWNIKVHKTCKKHNIHNHKTDIIRPKWHNAITVHIMTSKAQIPLGRTWHDMIVANHIKTRCDVTCRASFNMAYKEWKWLLVLAYYFVLRGKHLQYNKQNHVAWVWDYMTDPFRHASDTFDASFTARLVVHDKASCAEMN